MPKENSSWAPIRPGDRIRIVGGVFKNFEAIATAVDGQTGMISAEINIFGRITPIEVPIGEARRMI
jgi:transcription antitermination factor NusG